MGNSFPPDNPICPYCIDQIPVPLSIRNRQIHPLKSIQTYIPQFSAFFKSEGVRANADCKLRVQSECNWPGEAWLKNENKVGKRGQMTVTECYLLMSQFQI